MTEKPITILCVGNYLMGDEGVGVHLAKLLEQEQLPENVRLVEGGSGGFKLMEYFETGGEIILVDATLDDRPPGTIRLIRPRFAADFPRAMSTHEIGLKDLVESLTLMGTLPNIHLFVVSIAEVQPLTVELSNEVRDALPELKRRVIELCFQVSKETAITHA